MRYFFRLPCPDILSECARNSTKPRWIKYGESYTSNRNLNKGFTFQWPIVGGTTINSLILPTLRLQTVNHCSYCDGFPLKKGDNSIDHFLPKTKFTELVCQWENLYLSCSHCQASKKEDVNNFALRPDQIGFSFNTYFIYNYITNYVEINTSVSASHKQKAEETIKYFDLNHPALVISRRHAFQRYSGDQNPFLDDYNFRFMFE